MRAKALLGAIGLLGIAGGILACNPVTDPSPAAPPVPEESGDLASIVSSMVFPVAGILDYVPPTSAERAAFRSAFESILNGDETEAWNGFREIGLSMTRFSDRTGASFFLIRETGDAPRGWGLYAVRNEASRGLAIEAPHPLADLRTEDQAADLFVGLSARALLIAGSHRCASPAFSPCGGSTSVCNVSGSEEPYRVSDASHSDDQVFQAAHEALLESDPELKAVALHGFSQGPGDPQAFVSDGTEEVSDGLSRRFASALNEATGIPAAALSCNEAGTAARLCGTQDIQARSANGSPEACTETAVSSAQRFLHVEQSLDLRADDGPGDAAKPSAVLEALIQTFD